MSTFQGVQQDVVEFHHVPFSPIHKKVTAGAYIGQISDGYMLGIIGIALSYATEPLGLTSFWLGMCGAGSMVGILIGGLLIGPVVDKIGRRPIFNKIMAIMMVLAMMQFFINSAPALAILRFCLGLCIGIDYAVGITLLSEWVPEKNRVKIMSGLLVLWTVGYTIAYIVGFFMNSLGEDGWRWVLATSAIPAGITCFVRLGTPESPRWLVKNGCPNAAQEIILKFLGPKCQIPQLQKVEKASWGLLFTPKYRYNTIVSCVFFAAQVLPFYAISIFLPLVMEKLNVSNPYASGVLYNVFTMIGVLIGLFLLPRIGRRPYLLYTFYSGAIVMAIMTFWTTMPGAIALALLTLLSLILAISIVMEYIYPAELFPTEIRGSGVGLTVAASRIGAASAAFLLPVITEHFGIYTALSGCIVTLIIGGIVCHLWAPETSEQPHND